MMPGEEDISYGTDPDEAKTKHPPPELPTWAAELTDAQRAALKTAGLAPHDQNAQL